MSSYTLEGLPVEGDIVAPYLLVQQTCSGRAWLVVAQCFNFAYIMQMIGVVDLTKSVRIVHVTKSGAMSVVRSWN